MSFLLDGMALGALASATPDSSLSIRERILRNVKATLESIQQVSPAEPGAANVAGTTATPGGTYTGTVTRKYRLEIVGAGASGVATYTVTDVTPADQQALWADGTALDHGPVAQVVTSGAALDVGSLGATLTLTFSGSLAAGEQWEFWAGPYQSNVACVCREEDARQSDETWIEMNFPDEDLLDGPLSKRTSLLSVSLVLHMSRSPTLATDLERILADVMKALMVDRQRGDLAVDTEFPANVGLALQQIKAEGLCDLAVLIHYRTRDDDPRLL